MISRIKYSCGITCSRVLSRLGAGCFLFFFLFHIPVTGQTILPGYPDSLFSPYYHQRVSHFATLPGLEEDVIFLGNSITDGGEWRELFRDPRVADRGINGETTAGVLNRLEQAVGSKPAKVFLLIGINDLAAGISPDTVFRNILRIVSLIREYSPATAVYVQSIFPVNGEQGQFPAYVNKGKQINYVNQLLRESEKKARFIYVDVYEALTDRKGSLDRQYTNDGLHLLGSGYMLWKHVVYPYVYDLQQHPSIVPRPQSVRWNEHLFPLYRCRNIVISGDSLEPLAEHLKRMWREAVPGAGITIGSRADGPFIELRIAEVPAPLNREEAYLLTVTDDRIVITGNTLHGLFNGIQTLRQLIRDGAFVGGCRIRDWPAFSWRGYMVDVGRNYQSPGQLKEQIDIMSHYKLNVFHLHLTENIAWRLQIKRYPQLTEAKYMVRNKGQYYTIEEMQELIRYCRERYITLVPEIDMPGHSAAFERAMGVNMQSDSGLKIVKNILTEVDSTYDIPYIHIGADEVKITNKDFIPEATALVHRGGKQTIGWSPGGNYDDKTIRHLYFEWSESGPDTPHVYFIDSRHLYLNLMDPLSGVNEIFHKKICDAEKGDKYLLGGEICVWNDNRAKSEKDIIAMNLVYPAMVTFGERSWRGGGYENVLISLGADTSAKFRAFVEFENRLLDQKQLFFKGKPFPYVRQTDIRWKLYGPFDNRGNTSEVFWPEIEPDQVADSLPAKIVHGGTIWLHHFYSPSVKGIIEQPRENSTYYAYREIYSPIDRMGAFWIGFSMPERAFPIYTPGTGQWDFQDSKLWINGKMIPPPRWTYPGRKGEPGSALEDESYEYRKPTEVFLKKGWNTVLVKLPATVFKGWGHRPKWMFTVVQVHEDGGQDFLR